MEDESRPLAKLLQDTLADPAAYKVCRLSYHLELILGLPGGLCCIPHHMSWKHLALRHFRLSAWWPLQVHVRTQTNLTSKKAHTYGSQNSVAWHRRA